MDETKASDHELLQAAFQALLKGNTAERDRLCDLILARHKEREARDIRIAQAASPYFKKH